MVTRSPTGNANLLKDQYALLKDSVDDFYAGVEAKAIEIAVRIRTLVHHNPAKNTHAFLSTIDSNYMSLEIYRRIPPGSKSRVLHNIRNPDVRRRHGKIH